MDQEEIENEETENRDINEENKENEDTSRQRPLQRNINRPRLPHRRPNTRPIRVEGQIVKEGEVDENGVAIAEEEVLAENQVFTFIIHGTMDEDESKIDDDEDLEKRKKYIYDLRYWAWKRLNAVLEKGRNPVAWDHVMAYYYRHSEDSIWSKMFSPPVYWSPVDSLGNVMTKVTEAGVFGKYDFANAELTEANISIVRNIAKYLYQENTVLLYGFSVGGFVVQRICEILNVCVKNERLSELILGVVLNDLMLNRFKVATFGSSYIAPMDRVKDVRIMNYILLDDVVTRTNFFEFGLGFTLPTFEEFTEEDGDSGFVLNHSRKKLYQFMAYNDTNIFYLQKWSTEWLIYEKPEEIRKKNFIEYKIDELKNKYSKHNAKYDLLFNKLLKSHAYAISELDTVEYTRVMEGQAAAVAATDIPVPVAPATRIDVRVVEPVDTVEELVVQGVVRLSDDFYANQRNYVSEESRQARIDRKLREAQEARIALDEAMQRREDQVAQRAARARKRAAIKEVREEMNDISHHAADDILELHHDQNVPIIVAEEPEQDMLDFSLIMAQLETKAMFLKGDGLVNLRSLTRSAIDRGKSNRTRLPAAAAGGGGVL